MFEPIADGTHAGLRWFVQAESDGRRLVTVDGHIGPRYVHHAGEYEAPTPASIRRLCETLAQEPVKGRKAGARGAANTPGSLNPHRGEAR